MYKVLCSVLMLAVVSFGGIITVVPTASDIGQIDAIKTDLSDLDHGSAYIWRLYLGDDFTSNNFSVDNIESVTLKIEDIYDWTSPDVGNVLYINMLNQNACNKSDLVEIFDDGNDGNGTGNFFETVRNTTINGYSDVYGYNQYAGYSATSFVGQWSDTDGPASSNDLTYNLDLNTFKSYLGSDNVISLGFDSDCHFFNNGVRLEITTKSVPEPTLISLLGCGLLGLVFIRRKK